MQLNLAQTVFDYLSKHPEERFTARQIAAWVFENHAEECREKKNRSKRDFIPLDTDAALVQQLVAEIGSQRPKMEKRWSQLKTTDGRPRKYYYSPLTDEAEVAAIGGSLDMDAEDLYRKQAERNLYPLLSEYLWRELNLYSKRIDEKRSQNSRGRGGNHWLFPDLVGLQDLSADWHTEIRDCVKQIADRKTKLWSFEVKSRINRSNVREAYFQAVSNSSWANYGYLVASEIQAAEGELRILAGLHGIGLIKLDEESPADSEIIIPARSVRMSTGTSLIGWPMKMRIF